MAAPDHRDFPWARSRCFHTLHPADGAHIHWEFDLNAHLSDGDAIISSAFLGSISPGQRIMPTVRLLPS